jgi:kynureninase
MTPVFEPRKDFAKRLDERDPLAPFRERFALPTRDGEPVVYFNGNSLGLMPKAARELVDDELDDWARSRSTRISPGRRPGFRTTRCFGRPSARLVGALPDEVVVMNG